jgi:hypothetical protein
MPTGIIQLFVWEATCAYAIVLHPDDVGGQEAGWHQSWEATA